MKPLVAFTCLHAVLALGAIVYGHGTTSAQFDNPGLPPHGAGIAEVMAEMLTVPGRLLWTSWASQNLPNALEWGLFIANSMLWGAVAVLLMNAVWARRH